MLELTVFKQVPLNDAPSRVTTPKSSPTTDLPATEIALARQLVALSANKPENDWKVVDIPRPRDVNFGRFASALTLR